MSAESTLPVAAVRVAPPGLRSDLRAVRVVWQRELIRFGQDKIRIVAALVQPVLFLFVLGTGLQSLTSASTGGTASISRALGSILRSRNLRAVTRERASKLDTKLL